MATSDNVIDSQDPAHRYVPNKKWRPPGEAVILSHPHIKFSLDSSKIDFYGHPEETEMQQKLRFEGNSRAYRQSYLTHNALCRARMEEDRRLATSQMVEQPGKHTSDFHLLVCSSYSGSPTHVVEPSVPIEKQTFQQTVHSSLPTIVPPLT
jgi:hypothetical protein